MPVGPTAYMVTGPSFTSAAAGARADPGQDSTRGPASASRGSRLRGARVWSRCSASARGPLVMVSPPCRGSVRHGLMSRRAGPSARRFSCCLPADVADRRVRWAAQRQPAVASGQDAGLAKTDGLETSMLKRIVSGRPFGVAVFAEGIGLAQVLRWTPRRTRACPARNQGPAPAVIGPDSPASHRPRPRFRPGGPEITPVTGDGRPVARTRCSAESWTVSPTVAESSIAADVSTRAVRGSAAGAGQKTFAKIAEDADVSCPMPGTHCSSPPPAGCVICGVSRTYTPPAGCVICGVSRTYTPPAGCVICGVSRTYHPAPG
jgi:hypothetical protein